MGLLDFLRSRPKNTATLATERLRIIVAQERATNGRPDYLPLLRRELLEVIRKYVNVDPDAIDIHIQREGTSDVLELSVALPEKLRAAAAAKAAAPAGEN
ncbi:MAG: cell division topological specificity factor MinE [Rhodanobacter sp.]|jgi:cell division topological specificity factor|nr:cell division topological specificity factor MinE [Rhodanobacter sp.]